MKIVNINDELPVIFEHNNLLYVLVESTITNEDGLIDEIKTHIKISDDISIEFEQARHLAIEALNSFKEQREAE